jgi:hypothetical protein
VPCKMPTSTEDHATLAIASTLEGLWRSRTISFAHGGGRENGGVGGYEDYGHVSVDGKRFWGVVLASARRGHADVTRK